MSVCHSLRVRCLSYKAGRRTRPPDRDTRSRLTVDIGVADGVVGLEFRHFEKKSERLKAVFAGQHRQIAGQIGNVGGGLSPIPRLVAALCPIAAFRLRQPCCWFPHRPADPSIPTENRTYTNKSIIQFISHRLYFPLLRLVLDSLPKASPRLLQNLTGESELPMFRTTRAVANATVSFGIFI